MRVQKSDQAQTLPQSAVGRAAPSRQSHRESVIVNQRQEMLAQRKSSDMFDGCQRALQQKALIDGIDNSPRMVAQRKQLDGMFGGATPMREVVPETQQPESSTDHANDAGFHAIANAAASPFNDDFSYPILGFTSKPANAEGPDIEFNAEQNDDQTWSVKPTVTGASNEGTNTSDALAAGIHRVEGEQENDKDLYVEVSPAMAASILAAEDEHNNDYRYAKEQILDVVDEWLPAFLQDTEFATANTEDEAIDAAEGTINAYLKNDLLHLDGVDDVQWANIAAYYIRACNMTGSRDDNGWHSFEHATMEAEDRVTHRITAGASQIGNHGPEDVILIDQIA